MVGAIERALRGRSAACIAVAAFAALIALAVSGLWTPRSAVAETFDPIVRTAQIDGPLDVDWFVLFALAGETYSLTLERHTLPAGEITIWQPASDESEARMVARAPGSPHPMIWTAPSSGAWRARVSGVRGSTGSYRLRIQGHSDAVGSDLATARLGSYDAAGVLIERSLIDNPGDVDWFAFAVAAGNRYEIWSVPGSVAGLSASVREPESTGFEEVQTKGPAFSDILEPSRDGLAIIAVQARETWMTGSYAFGITRRGTAPEREFVLPEPQQSRLRIGSIEAAGSPGLAEFSFEGEWGPLSQRSGLRVWIDTDPDPDQADEWEFLLRSLDGRNWSLWSFENREWIERGYVSADGFDTLVMRWSGRTADERIRWQASVKNSDGTWTLSRPQWLEVPHPPPALPTPWVARERTGPEDPRYHAELRAAGVVEEPPGDALVVVLDPGHGVDTGAWDNGVLEAESNLRFALRIEQLLEARGVYVALTRRSAGRPYLNLDEALWRPDYQARAELAHRAKADLFVSIHSNANFRLPINGLEAWYLPRWHGDEANLRLSELLLDYLQRGLAEYGYPTSTLVYDSSCWEIINNTCDPIYVLAPFLQVDADAARRWGYEPAELGLSDDPFGPAVNHWLWRNDITVGEPPIDLIDPETQTGPGKIIRGNLMPTVLLELLYVTHEGDARILRDPGAREVIAEAIADGILEFLGVE